MLSPHHFRLNTFALHSVFSHNIYACILHGSPTLASFSSSSSYLQVFACAVLYTQMPSLPPSHIYTIGCFITVGSQSNATSLFILSEAGLSSATPCYITLLYSLLSLCPPLISSCLLTYLEAESYWNASTAEAFSG
jgi:hypothetical protein